MLFNQSLLKVLKIIILTIIYLFIVLAMASGVALILPIRVVYQSTGLHVDIISNVGFAFSVILSAIILGVLLLKLNLKVMHSVIISFLLVLFNFFVFNRSVDQIHEHLDSILILVITPVTVFYIFKKYKKDTNIKE